MYTENKREQVNAQKNERLHFKWWIYNTITKGKKHRARQTASPAVDANKIASQNRGWVVISLLPALAKCSYG